jgi:hypothetical protein
MKIGRLQEETQGVCSEAVSMLAPTCHLGSTDVARDRAGSAETPRSEDALIVRPSATFDGHIVFADLRRRPQ